MTTTRIVSRPSATDPPPSGSTVVIAGPVAGPYPGGTVVGPGF